MNERTARTLAWLWVLGFFLLLLVFRVNDLYHAHFYERGPAVVAWQAMRFLYIPYLFWLQYALGAMVLRKRAFGHGLMFTIAACLLGTSLWHLALLVVGLAGWYHAAVMVVLAGGVMLASRREAARVWCGLAQSAASLQLSISERGMLMFALGSGVAFLVFKGLYPSGAHDFFNHYFTYYKEVIATGNFGPHATWYQYFYSKGLGVFFMSMLLLDPLAIHPAAMSLIIMAALMVFDLLRQPGRDRTLPFLGVGLYFLLYIVTNGLGLFALNGGWGDLEKTHELSAVFLLACLWITVQWVERRDRFWLFVLAGVNAAMVAISFASLTVAGMFYLLVLGVALLRRTWSLALMTIWAGASLGAAALVIMLINYGQSGLPQDQQISWLWPLINWRTVVEHGYTLELYSLLYDHLVYGKYALPFWDVLPNMMYEYTRFYLLWPLGAAGIVLALVSRRMVAFRQEHRLGLVLLYLFGGLLVAAFLGGRSQPISFFRFSTFNYAPMLLACLLLWRHARPRHQWLAVGVVAAASFLNVQWRAPYVWSNWYGLARSAYALNTGHYSLRDAVADQRGRVGRLGGGGVYPAMEVIYSALPAGTRVWSLHNHSYCLLPACNAQQYYSQITLRRWYDVVLSSIPEGKKILQEEGLNFIFYSRSVPVVGAADSKDQLAGMYAGLAPEHIEDTFGILWTNGWDYLLTWKEESLAPLDQDFMDSWRLYQEQFVKPRNARLPLKALAAVVKKAVEDPMVKTPPAMPSQPLAKTP